jgi:hypothetical protein
LNRLDASTERKRLSSEKAYHRQVKKRERKIRHVLSSLPSRESLKTLRSSDVLPHMQLLSASQQYILGFFENSVLNSAFAAEYGIILKLNEKFSKEEKENIAKGGGLSFSVAIRKARKVDLIEERLTQDLLMLCDLRNMAAHPSNYITLFRQLVDSDPIFTGKSLEIWITTVIGKSPEVIEKELGNKLDKKALGQALETLLDFKNKQFDKLPNLQWAANRQTLKSQIPIVKKYSQRMVKDMLLKKRLLDLEKNPKKATEFILNRYSYIEDIALDSIEIAFSTLKQLQLITT